MSVGETAVGHVPLRAVRFPGKYIQGPGAIRLLGAEAKSFGLRAFCILDRGIAEALRPKLQSAFGNDSELSTVTHGGNCTMAEIASLERQASKYRSDCIIGLGGGKALDTSKAVANSLNLPCMVVPTIAASDAPCSALAIIYNEDGSLDRAMNLARNPDVVVADTNIISAAPARFMAAGIGDGLATCIEANACRASGADKTFGFQGLELAFEIARLCEDTLLEFGERAIAECREGACGVATERVVEANILLSGLGFESCGVAAAHGIQDGLCELEETHSSLHGEKVAIGILGELLFQEVEGRAYNRCKSLMEKIGLPATLRQIGIPGAPHDQLHQVALRACRDGDSIHNEPMPVTPDMVVCVLRELA